MLKDFGFALKEAQKLQEKIAKVQEKLEELTVKGSSGGGMVEVIANGRQQILGIKIEKEVIGSEDKEMLEDLIVAAVNQALKSSQELANEEMSKVTGGLLSNLPEGFKIPGLG